MAVSRYALGGPGKAYATFQPKTESTAPTTRVHRGTRARGRARNYGRATVNVLILLYVALWRLA